MTTERAIGCPVIALIRLEDCPDSHKRGRRGGKRRGFFTVYCVKVDGKEIGQVFQAREHVYKTSGNIRYVDSYPLRWQYQPLGLQSRAYRWYFDTRKQALDALLRAGASP